jgi:hypothetical protein
MLMRLIVLLLFIPSASAEMLVSIDIGQTGVVREDVTLSFNETYDTIDYVSQYKPISVDYSGNYILIEEDGHYIIQFPYSDSLSFSLVYDGLVEGTTRKVFRSGFSGGPTELSVKLPARHSLSEKMPNAVPRPDSMTTDGQRITLHWKLPTDGDVTVFYETRGFGAFLWLGIAVVLLTSSLLFLFFYGRSKKQLKELLSDDEAKVLEMLSKETRQDRIAKTLEFSKSKMSKVLRKLEEKNLISKEPYFKTNTIKKK